MEDQTKNTTAKAAVTEDIATAEVTKWLDFKKISPSKRTDKKDQIKQLINAIIDGDISINDDQEIVQKLKTPIGDKGQITEFKYKPRITVGAVQQHLQRIATSDADGRVVCYIQALTGQSSGLIKGLDSVDYDIAQTIAIFFI